MSKINDYEDHLLQMIFQNIVTGSHIANIGDGLRASVTPLSLHVSLHVADPGEAPAMQQIQSETSYDGYPPNGRQAVARSAAGWLVLTGVADNVADIDFPAGGPGAGATITFFGVGTAATGAGQLLYRGTVTPNLVVSNNVQPKFAIGDCNVAED